MAKNGWLLATLLGGLMAVAASKPMTIPVSETKRKGQRSMRLPNNFHLAGMTPATADAVLPDVATRSVSAACGRAAVQARFGEDDDKDYAVCAKTAARYVGLSQKTLANWRVSGTGPAFFRVGGRSIRYSMAVLRAFRAASARHSTSEA